MAYIWCNYCCTFKPGWLHPVHLLIMVCSGALTKGGSWYRQNSVQQYSSVSGNVFWVFCTDTAVNLLIIEESFLIRTETSMILVLSQL